MVSECEGRAWMSSAISGSHCPSPPPSRSPRSSGQRSAWALLSVWALSLVRYRVCCLPPAQPPAAAAGTARPWRSRDILPVSWPGIPVTSAGTEVQSTYGQGISGPLHTAWEQRGLWQIIAGPGSHALCDCPRQREGSLGGEGSATF